MLLAAGVYPAFIGGIAEVTTFRFRARTLIILGAICGSAALAIVVFAGLIKTLVIDHRWIMYSLFIGLTLGGIPVIWRLLRRLTASAAAGGAAGIAVMALITFIEPGARSDSSGHGYLLLFIAGLAGASAMILPGVSGGYLLLILGQYLTILEAIDNAKTGLTASGGPDWAAVMSAMHVFIPVGVGVVIGVVGVSNLVKIFLEKYEKGTLGFLLGLLLGAVLGLWPFQQGVAPRPGDVIKGRVMTPELIAAVAPKDYPVEIFSPSGLQILAALGLIAAGFLITMAVARLGRDK
jgi:putative membrane protein